MKTATNTGAKNMRHVKGNIYICATSLKYFARSVRWEYGTLTTVWEPLS